jgi:ABC-type branched-subunit amino acid transport system substrate-binding protein
MRKAFYLLAASMLFAASPAFAQDTITIGFTASQTGALNNDSTAQMRGIELWRDDVNGKAASRSAARATT